MQRYGVGLNSGQFIVVNVDVDQRGGLTSRIAQGETSADANYDIGRRQDVIKLVHLLTLAARTEAGTVAKGMIIRHSSLAPGGGYHRDVGGFRQIDQSLFRVRAGNSAAGVNHRQPGPGDYAGGFLQQLQVWDDTGNRGRIPQHHFFTLDAGIRRNLDDDRPRATGTHLPEAFRYRVWDFPWPDGSLTPLGHCADRSHLVQHFMDCANSPVDQATRHLAGDEHNGNRTGVSGRQTGRRIVDPDSGHHEGHARFPGCAGVTVGHIGGSLLVTGRDNADAGFVPERRENAVDLNARNAENYFDVFSHQGLNQRFPSAHNCQGTPASFGHCLSTGFHWQ